VVTLCGKRVQGGSSRAGQGEKARGGKKDMKPEKNRRRRAVPTSRTAVRMIASRLRSFEGGSLSCKHPNEEKKEVSGRSREQSIPYPNAPFRKEGKGEIRIMKARVEQKNWHIRLKKWAL